jgi:hypothetical protein
MKRLSVLVTLLILPSLAFSQTTSHRTPQSDREQKRLSYFVGTWTLVGELKTSPFGIAGKFTGTQRNEWAADHLSLVSRWDEQRPEGSDTGTSVYTYDTDRKLYKYHGTDSAGEVEDSTGTVTANTWIWMSQLTVSNGTSMKGRYTETITSPTSYDFKFDVAPPDGQWTTALEGKAQKTK